MAEHSFFRLQPSVNLHAAIFGTNCHNLDRYLIVHAMGKTETAQRAKYAVVCFELGILVTKNEDFRVLSFDSIAR